MKRFLFFTALALLTPHVIGQTCIITSKANIITPDKLCSPVTATWNVSYVGVNNAGTEVQIRFDWDNGTVVIVPATETRPGEFEATATNVYTSSGNICNYHPEAMLIVNGVLCTSSIQEQIVTVWDDDNHNGGHMNIHPDIYPVCYGTSANVRFQDLTRFNCVPPQERDNPNITTRWVRWTYGVEDNMSGTPVTINGRRRHFPYSDDIIVLDHIPVTGSGVWSDVINVADDHQIGDFFKVVLHNWNYCNPYDDPNIPGPPRDRIWGDHPPVVDTAMILIVPYPDATINPVNPMCANADPVVLTAHDPGGTWSGPGITGNTFDPKIAGPGNHTISYEITNAYNCSGYDVEVITVYPIPDATIITQGLVCDSDPAFNLVAQESGGIWSGPGVVGNTFDPGLPGPGNHVVTYTITDANGCTDTDQTTITVATPDATIYPVDTLCIDNPAVRLTAHDLGGVWSGPGVIGDMFNPMIAGVGDHIISYEIVNPACSDSDTTVITVMPVPEIDIINPGTQYINGPPIILQADPAGGIWSGNGISGNTFNPNIAGLGTHIIKYETIPDRWGCMSMDTIHITVLMPPIPVAGFSPDTTGCSPLTVQFRNTSLYGEIYIWDFGDGIYSNEENPAHTYYIPGNYHVKLTVTNLTSESVANGIINVYQNPVSIFDAYPTNVVNNEQIVVFYNYSHHGSSYLWDFGDGSVSTEENPYHKYLDPGSYTVSLAVTSKDGCIDTSFMHTPVVVEWKTGRIGFPNVFKWNETGPTGGQWREGVYAEMDFVFRPFYENVIEYQLQIFNRWGVLIFESNELSKGWDGYFGDGNLAMQGVYVWKVKGRYADGTYFNKVGDVTFLH